MQYFTADYITCRYTAEKTFKERKVFKGITIAILIVFAVTNALLLYFRLSRYAVPVVYAVLLETILVVLGKIFNGRLAETTDEQ